jgi:hypothetical protein
MESLAVLGKEIGVNTVQFLCIRTIFQVNEHLENLSQTSGNLAVLHLVRSNNVHWCIFLNGHFPHLDEYKDLEEENCHQKGTYIHRQGL